MAPNKNLLCVFCYKKPGKYFGSKEDTSGKLISLLGRYLRANLNSESFILCEDCSHLGSTFCDLYFQFERIKMELDWKVKMFCDTMILARKVPSRYVAFKEQFGWSKSQQEFQKIQDFRTIVIKHGKLKLKGSKPRLILRRLERPVTSEQLDTSSLTQVEVRSFSPSPPTEVSNPPNCISNETPPEKPKMLPTQPPASVPNETLSEGSKTTPKNPPASIPNETPPEESKTIPIEAEQDNLDDLMEGDDTYHPILSFHLLTEFQDEPELHIPDQDPLQIAPEEESLQEEFYMVENNNHPDFNDSQNEGAIDIEFKVVTHPEQLTDEDEQEEMDIEFAANDDDLDDMEDFPSSSDEKEDEDDSDYEAEPEENPKNDQLTARDDDKCGTCGRDFPCEAAVEKHRVLVHKLKNYVRCPLCTKMFGGFLQYRGHRTFKRHGNKCYTQEKKSIVPSAFAEYPSDANQNGEPLFCPKTDCYELFYSEPKLQVHLSTHGVWNCSKCSEVFDKAHRLAWHEVEAHKKGDDDELFRCTRCRATFTQKNGFTDHFLQKHLGLKTSNSKTRSSSSKHLSLTGTGPKTCPICKIELPPCDTRQVLQEHVKNYHYVGDMDPSEISKCDVCQAPFTSQELLDEHFRIVHELEDAD
ncbi:Zinc finger and BTB domain-containing protein 16-A [Orchesella cincta]|uniref:Zinc finger and BTB domain-containing protein 16-A n=1 Tax=Orchesella cincta TaxID=48709 RepID=A0A1D2MPP0_ORCCI|nr:Zinc finger and BTB domain-containing protein 16-A [Orchesella cincta]